MLQETDCLCGALILDQRFWSLSVNLGSHQMPAEEERTLQTDHTSSLTGLFRSEISWIRTWCWYMTTPDPERVGDAAWKPRESPVLLLTCSQLTWLDVTFCCCSFSGMCFCDRSRWECAVGLIFLIVSAWITQKTFPEVAQQINFRTALVSFLLFVQSYW